MSVISILPPLYYLGAKVIKLSGNLKKAIKKINKSNSYLQLDLSNCTTKENIFYTELFPERMHDRVVSLILPDSIETIHRANFINLCQISGRNVLKINKYAFYNCELLQSIDFPKLTDIGEYAFADCLSLESVDLPRMHEVDDIVFCNCKSLKTINLFKYHINEFLPDVCNELFD